MLSAPRLTQLSARRALTLQNPTLRFRFPIHKLTAPPITASKIQTIQSRLSTTTTTTTPQPTPTSLLTAQRLLRPVSPHLTIYKAQIPWYLSGLNRITGSLLSGSVYLFATAYVVAPLFGWHLESAAIAEAFGGWSAPMKGAVKMVVAWPFAFHCWNGVRHLAWDLGWGMGNARVVRSGWVVVGLSVASSVGLGLFV